MELIELIKKDFSELIKEYNLTISSPFPSIVELRNENCKIQIQRERGIEVYLSFTNQKSKREYGLVGLTVFRQLENDIKELKSNGIFNLYAQIVDIYFSDILRGDFSWSDDYDVFMKHYNS